MKLIVAAARDWGIGRNGGMLFRLPNDLAFFKKTTINNVVVMGKNTLLSFQNQKPLKNRTNIVLTRDKNFEQEGCIICNSYGELFKELEKYDTNNVYLIGGGQLYNELYPYCDEAYVTKVDAVEKADTYLHNFDEDKTWELTFVSELIEDNGYKITFNTYKNLDLKNFENI